MKTIYVLRMLSSCADPNCQEPEGLHAMDLFFDTEAEALKAMDSNKLSVNIQAQAILAAEVELQGSGQEQFNN